MSGREGEMWVDIGDWTPPEDPNAVILQTFTPEQLRAHDDRIRAEALAPVLALADPDAMGRAMWQVSGLDEGLIDLAAPVAAAALRVAAGTPTHHTTEEDT